MNVDTTNPSNILIDLNMNDNLYIQSTLGLFLTGKYGCTNYDSSYELYYANPIAKTTVKLNMNNHKIYGKKLYLAIPPSGNGEIISDETIDIAYAYDCNMDILSAKSISMGCWLLNNNQTINYNGIIYAKDDVIMKWNNVWNTSLTNTELNAKGSVVNYMTKTSIYHNYNSLSNLVNLRGNDFKVRKMLSEILK